ncbi:MAG: hypothetical protein RR461_10815, partial [Angelakisella sp.]
MAGSRQYFAAHAAAGLTHCRVPRLMPAVAFTLEPPKVNKSSQKGNPFDIPRLSACGHDVRTARLTRCA